MQALLMNTYITVFDNLIISTSRVLTALGKSLYLHVGKKYYDGLKETDKLRLIP